MKSSLAMTVLLAWRLAVPGYHYEFPRDHFSHPEFRTEWWYYTGNLRSTDGHRFGFELTFFRHASRTTPADANVWDPGTVWMAHLALSDIDGARFYNTERINRTGPGIAGADATKRLVWNGNWSAQWTSSADQHLTAIADDFRLALDLHSLKPPVIHGVNGVSQKSAEQGRASHYVSLTRLQTRGTITVDGRDYQVEGLSWMDHEFFTEPAGSIMAGWDWFSLQFTDGSELMLYRLRHKDGTLEPFSSGTYVEPSGRSHHLKLSDFSLEPGETWLSPPTKAAYPVAWKVRVPSLGIDLKVTTPLRTQELVGKQGVTPTYWEGAVDVSGSHRGSGYLEMTGYAGAVKLD